FKHNGISICQRWVSSMYEKADKSKDEFRITLKKELSVNKIGTKKGGRSLLLCITMNDCD
ncbi:hypothetical protein, partial [Vibrio sp. OPT46]|uniref:hypothetical protein n=1 Tax=Vibrio sp. OPT46 TaxID=2778645 RepID=UPI001D1375C3